jgi:hypothetical protein
MTIHHMALLLGLFAVPVVALAIGFKFRKQGERARSIFWGAIIGHTVATVIASVAAIWPPREPGPGDEIRSALILWTLLLGGVIGALLALARTSLRNRESGARVRLVPILLAEIALGSALAACTRDEPPPVPIGAIDTLTAPAGRGSREPNLSVSDDDRVLLTWMELGTDSAYSLRMATLDDGASTWSEPATITRGRRFFVNWADFPSAIALPDGRLAVHWLERSASGTYDYDVRIAQSTDGGATWSQDIVPHRDGTNSEHGFATLFDAGRGLLGAVWLDGRKYAGEQPTKEMTLAHTTLSADGALGEERIVDPRICDCCQTSGAITSRGPVIVYRDRSADEIRDISIVRLVDGSWTEPRPVHEDGWHLDHCPVNGPAVDAEGDEVVVAWYTEAPDTMVNVAFSSDAGVTFSAPLRIDQGRPVGRVDVELLGSGRAVVTWIERAEDGAEVRARAVSTSGPMGAPVAIGRSSESRAAGFPRMVRQGDRLVFAWTVAGPPSSIVVTTAALP